MLQPKRTKFRKQFKGRIHGTAKGGTNLDFGGFGLKALEPNRVTAREIEAARPHPFSPETHPVGQRVEEEAVGLYAVYRQGVHHLLVATASRDLHGHRLV